MIRRGVVAVVALMVACSGQRPPPPSLGVKTPLTVAKVAPSGKLAAAEPEGEPLSLERFTPLLARPELKRAAQLLDAGNAAGAAREVAGVVAKSPPSAEDVPRWQMLLGSLRERAGDLAGAAASYELAAASDWPLKSYALLGAGRALLGSGHTDAALERLARVPSDLPIADATRLLVAEAAMQKGDRDLAIQSWQAHLDEKPTAPDRTTLSLSLAAALLARATDAKAVPRRTDNQDDLVRALALARRIDLEQTGTGGALQLRAQGLEKKILDALPKKERARLAHPTPAEELIRVQALLGAGQDDGAEQAAEDVLKALPPAERSKGPACEMGILRAKALAMKHEAGKAADALDELLRRCKGDDDLKARALYLAGRYAAKDGRHMAAIQHYEKLEKELPHHRLADDARLLAAISYFDLGVEARFTELLSSMPDDFPEGDMVVDGVFRLALRRIEKGDWSGAANVLDRASRLVGPRDSTRGSDFSGRERYFRARAWIETGEKERGEQELAALIRELPLSYYMLQAWSHLSELDPALANKTRDAAIRSSAEQPFRFEYRPEFDTPGFQRAMELLRQSDLDAAKAEIDALGIAKPGAAPALLWGIALLYSRAGSAALSHDVTRGLLTDWIQRWPAGDWTKAWQLAYPRPYHALVQSEAKQNGVPESLVYAVMREESAFDPRAASPAQAYGLMQLVVPTAKLYAKGLPYDARALQRPSISITLGSRALGKLDATFSGNPLLAIPAYNAGPGRPRRWLRNRPSVDFDVWVELIPFRETRRYTKRVLASRAAYAYLYDQDHADDAMRLPLILSP